MIYLQLVSYQKALKYLLYSDIKKREMKRRYRITVISIQPALIHIMVKCALNIITSLCETFAVTSEAQYGFLPGRGTIELLECLSDHIGDEFGNNQFLLHCFSTL